MGGKDVYKRQTWKIVMVSEGGTKHDFRLDFATEAEAEQAAAEDDWRYVDENQFEWRLEVEEDLTAVKQACLLYTSWRPICPPSCRATRGQAPRRSWNASSQPNTS